MAEPMMGASARPNSYSNSYQHHSSSNPYQYHSQTTQSHDQYRGQSSTGNHVALPSINLPSLRELDNPLQQSSHAQTMSQVSASLPPPSTYYSQHIQQPLQQSMGYSTIPGPGVNSAHMRYPLPAPTDARMMSGGRHKKEIKRRTKTGCLTCRKRRIKCDEQHPKCRNCLKSKRECAGYDPIFKQQQGPQTLQPALPNTSQSSLPTPPTSGSTHGITPGPPSYSTPSALLQQSPVQTTHHHVPSETTHGSEYRYSTSAPLHTPDEYTRPLLYHTPSNPEPYLTSSTSGSMENLFFVSGFPAPQIPPRTDPLHPNAYNEIRKVYLETFAEGCNALLETTWFLRAGADALMEDKELCYLMDDLLRRYATIGQTTDYTAEVTCRALETKAVWKLLSLVRRPSPYGVPAANDPSTIELFEARARLDVLEHLLKNSTASTNPVSTLHYPDAANHSHDKRQEVQFWSLVGDFISQPSTNPISATGAPPQNADQAPDTLLHSVRSGLKNLENRDVVYSIMCIRHLVKRHAGFPDHLQANPRAGEADDVNKLIIARDFLRKQAGWHGTTHPIQRVCDMATRSWTVFPR